LGADLLARVARSRHSEALSFRGTRTVDSRAGLARWTCALDLRVGLARWTCALDLRAGLARWTRADGALIAISCDAPFLRDHKSFHRSPDPHFRSRTKQARSRRDALRLTVPGISPLDYSRFVVNTRGRLEFLRVGPGASRRSHEGTAMDASWRIASARIWHPRRFSLAPPLDGRGRTRTTVRGAGLADAPCGHRRWIIPEPGGMGQVCALSRWKESGSDRGPVWADRGQAVDRAAGWIRREGGPAG
jgi:hypothetical protein